MLINHTIVIIKAPKHSDPIWINPLQTDLLTIIINKYYFLKK